MVTLAIVSAAYLGPSLFVTNSYYQLIMTLVPIWATFGVSWNILSGYGGQLSFGHASLFGIGRLCRHLSFGLLEHHPLAWDHLPERGAIDVLARISRGFGGTFGVRGIAFPRWRVACRSRL